MRRIGGRLDVPNLTRSRVQDDAVAWIQGPADSSGDVSAGIRTTLRLVRRNTIDFYFQVSWYFFLGRQSRLDLIKLHVNAVSSGHPIIAPDLDRDTIPCCSIRELEQRRRRVGILRAACACHREPF